jgi:murein DD-endopeptidase MepM/ murein hydrolase activator NlpD
MSSRRPRRARPILGFFLVLGFLPPGAGETRLLRFPGGTEVEIDAPLLEPGQIILARLLQAPDIRKITIRFGDDIYELGPQGEGLEPFALVGLDLGFKPGPYDIEINALLRDGRTETLKHRIQVGGRDFPVKKLWVKEEFVRPPAEVQDRIRREAEILEIAYSVSSKRWLGEGVFERPHPGNMSPNFGEKRIYNNVPRSTHSGVDIAADYGAPVKASNSGRVVLARDLYFSGKTVIIDHGLGLFTYYCHFSLLKVGRGDMVKKGSVIALAGSTGRSTGPHLHWGVRLRGSRVDPSGLLSLAIPE